MQVLNLQCSNCGANLEISPNLEQFACGYCGANLVVERSGGTVSLRRVTEAIKQVQAGTDKTAAELAIVRINEQLGQLAMLQEQVSAEWRFARGRVHSEYARIESSRRTELFVLLVLVGLVAFAIATTVIVAGLKGNRSAEPLAPLLIASIFYLPAIGVFITRFALKKAERYDFEKMKAHRSIRLKSIDAPFQQKLASISSDIAKLRSKLGENYKVVNR